MNRGVFNETKILWVSSIITTILSAATTVFGFVASNRLMYIKNKDATFIYDRELKAQRFDEKWFNQCPKDELSIDSPNGYSIKGIFFQPLNTKIRLSSVMVLQKTKLIL